jgi:hypothetical protein
MVTDYVISGMGEAPGQRSQFEVSLTKCKTPPKIEEKTTKKRGGTWIKWLKCLSGRH